MDMLYAPLFLVGGIIGFAVAAIVGLIAKFITEHPSLKPIVRVELLPAVAMSTVAVNTTTLDKAVMVGLLALLSMALTARATTYHTYDSASWK